MATLIKTNGTTKSVQPKNGTDFQLNELYDLIGCSMIQVCESKENGKILIFDEEAMFHHNTINVEATKMMNERMGPFAHNVIMGNAILCESKELY